LQHRLKYSLPRLKVSTYASGKKQNFSDIPNPELYNSLKQWRDKIVQESNIPIYMVANQNALQEIATYLPFSKKDLMKLSGFGKAKAEKYGDDLIDMVMEYCSRDNLESNMAAKEENPKRERKEKSAEEKTPSGLVSLNLFREGKSIEEIAKDRNMAKGTIERHLAAFVASKQINIDELVSAEKQNLIKDAVEENGKESLSALKRNLPENISFGEIRFVLAAETEP
jgi:ATP-dependent DNA helicase RecQ